METQKPTDSHRHYFYSRETELINKIFPCGVNLSKEHLARSIATRIGYDTLCDMKNGEVIEIDINHIFPCQEVISKTKLIEMLIFLRDNEVPGYPMGIRVGEEVYLLDGHHRVAAQIILGKKSVMVHVTDCTQKNKP